MNNEIKDSIEFNEFKLFIIEEFKFIESEYDKFSKKYEFERREAHEECENCDWSCYEKVSEGTKNNFLNAQENLEWAIEEIETQIREMNEKDKKLAINFLIAENVDIEGMDLT
jgi:Mg2+ and Co2+ transporter CorA